MSSRRSRSGGRCTSMVLRRNSRSCRKRPAVTSACRSALVAEISRTSARRVRDDPSRSNSPVSSTRRSFCCCPSGTLAISSRKSELPSASSNRPTRSWRASVKAPLTWPKSSLSKTPSDTPPALIVTIDRDGARRDAVQRPCDETLAGAVLAGDEDVGVRRADAGDDLEDGLHRRGVGDETGHGRRRRRIALCASSRSARRMARPSSTCVLDDRLQPLVVPRLLDEVAGAPAHRFDGEVHRTPRRHHHHRQRRVELLDLLQQVEPLGARRGVARVVQIDQHRVVLALAERGHDRRRRLDGVDQIAVGLEQQPERLEDVTLVIGDEEAGVERRARHQLASRTRGRGSPAF